jgi:hypothetical protein
MHYTAVANSDNLHKDVILHFLEPTTAGALPDPIVAGWEIDIRLSGNTWRTITFETLVPHEELVIRDWDGKRLKLKPSQLSRESRLPPEKWVVVEHMM